METIDQTEIVLMVSRTDTSFKNSDAAGSQDIICSYITSKTVLPAIQQCPIVLKQFPLFLEHKSGQLLWALFGSVAFVLHDLHGGGSSSCKYQ